jgi:hypothetical protein
LRQTAVWLGDDETPTREPLPQRKGEGTAAFRPRLWFRSQPVQFQYVNRYVPFSIFGAALLYAQRRGLPPGFGGVAQVGMQMKTLLFAGLLLFVGAGSVHAQADVGSTSGSIGASGSINSGGSLTSSSGINSTASTNNSSSVSGQPSYRNVEGQNPDAYVPSTFQNYDDAVSQGDEARKMRQPSLADVARKAQQAKAAHPAKPGVVLDRDATGKLVATPATPALAETPAVPATQTAPATPKK